MNTYDRISQNSSRSVARAYSTSFTAAIQLLDTRYRRHIYNLYGLVRAADEIVDTYRGNDSEHLLDRLEAETYATLKSGYSTNPLVHAFAITAREFDIDEKLIEPFFASMRLDLSKSSYARDELTKYVYGSAEVVGLMCLKVFTGHNSEEYDRLQSGARALGAAFQKVNFLRDIAQDHNRLGRSYFPGITLENLDKQAISSITYEIREDLAAALPSIHKLPKGSRTAVLTAYHYYHKLLQTIERSSLDKLKSSRICLSRAEKMRLLLFSVVANRLH